MSKVEPVQLTPKPGQPGAPLPRPCWLLLPWRTQLGKEVDEVAIIKMPFALTTSRSSSSTWSELFPQIRDAFLHPLSSADQQGLDGDRWGSKQQNYVVFIQNILQTANPSPPIFTKSPLQLYSGKRAGQGMFPDNQSLIEAGLATR